MSVTTKYETATDFLKSIPRKPVLEQIDITLIRNNISRSLPSRVSQSRLDLLIVTDHPSIAAELGPYKIVLDNTLVFPRMRLSPEFVRIQDVELILKTQDWMRDFFGMIYPIYVTDDQAIMSHQALRNLQIELRTQ